MSTKQKFCLRKITKKKVDKVKNLNVQFLQSKQKLKYYKKE